jgi:Zn-dependent protease/predicted transcriptional regulator
MRSSISLGTLFGIKVGLHYSWFLIAILIVFSLLQQFRLENVGWSPGTVFMLALATAALFFTFLLAHEMSHALVAKAKGIPVREITLFALGGVANIEKNAASASHEFLIAVVGPLTSFCLSALCLLLRTLTTDGSGFHVMLSWLAYINFALAVFNLLPAYPLDGGRILRAALWWRSGNADSATQVAARTGQVAGFVLIALGLFQFFGGAGLGGLWISFIGWFLLQAAGASYLEVGFSRALQGVTVADAMITDCVALDAGMTIQRFVDDVLLLNGRRCFTITENGTFAGLVTPADVRKIERNRWPEARLIEIMRPLDQVRTVDPETPLRTALEIMGKKDLNQLPVVDHGQIAGIVSRAEVLNLLNTRMQVLQAH